MLPGTIWPRAGQGDISRSLALPASSGRRGSWRAIQSATSWLGRSLAFPYLLRTKPALWILLAALLLASLYLPTLAAPFDFIDDGSIVYPYRTDSAYQFYRVYWGRIVANFGHLGPFRPALWIHWGLEAELFDGNEHTWRAARLVWTMLSAGLLLWLLHELGIPRSAAFLAAALAMWNPYRNEIWTSLTLSEGVAMPYALAALVCAVRAARSRRPWCWDLAGILCMVMALGCKNTFVALLPAQVFLRLAPDGRNLRQGIRRHGSRAALLALPLLLPIVHFAVFRLQWHPGQYEPDAPSWAQLGRMLSALKGALGLEWVGAGLVLAVVAVGGWRGFRSTGEKYRGACVAGGLLLVTGVSVYLPMHMISARYTMPAVWGADILIAALLGVLAGSAGKWRRAAYLALGCGLTVTALANLGRQEKFAARASLLQDALLCVESQAPPDAAVTWVCGPDLNLQEGIHFQWHLRGRGRADLVVLPRDEEGRLQSRIDHPVEDREADFLVTGSPGPPAGTGWEPAGEARTSFWAGRRSYHCYVWRQSN